MEKARYLVIGVRIFKLAENRIDVLLQVLLHRLNVEIKRTVRELLSEQGATFSRTRPSKIKRTLSEN